jgi:hypothetical protein
MIEEIALPVNAQMARSVPLPTPNNLLHARVRSKGRKHMNVIGHQEEER